MRQVRPQRAAIALGAATAVAMMIAAPLLANHWAAHPTAVSAPSVSELATATVTPTPTPTPTPTDASTAGPAPDVGPAPKPSMSTAPDIVPWSPTLYDEKTPTLIPDSVPEPGLTRCAPADVRVSLMDFTGGLTGGGIGGQLRVVARPGHRCLLQGWPSITFRDASGQSIAAAQLYESFTLPYAITMDVAQVATSMIQLRGNTSANKIVTVGVGLPGWVSPVVLGYRGEQPHYMDASPGSSAYALIWGFSPMNGAALAYSGLRGLFMMPTDLPADVTPGSDMHYQLEVMPMQDDVAFSPCIGFRETLRDSETDAVVASEDHVLNCSGVGTIAKMVTVRFAMQIHVPASAIPGRQLVLHWQAVTGQDEGESRPVTVR